MKKVAVITDSNSGITQSEAKKLGIHVVPMPFFVNGDTFYEDISMSQDEFYGYLAQGADVMTSQPAPDTLMKLWDSVLECYDEIVYIPMSSGLSSSCGTAMMLSYEEKYENKVFVVDNRIKNQTGFADSGRKVRCLCKSENFEGGKKHND